MKTKTRVGLARLDVTELDSEDNSARIWALAETARAQSVDLLVLPELSNVGQVGPWTPSAAMDYVRACEASEAQFLSDMASCARSNNLHVLVGFAECHPTVAGAICNSAGMFSPSEGLTGVQRKLHLPQVEDRYFTPGGALTMFETDFAAISVLICYDLYFPELAFATARAGSDLLCGLANIPFRPNWPHRIEHITGVRSYENMQYVAVVNRGGEQHGADYHAERTVAEPPGHLIEGDSSAESLVVADLSPAILEEARQRRPILSVRQADTPWHIERMQAV